MLIGELVINFARHCDFFLMFLRPGFIQKKKYSEVRFDFYNQYLVEFLLSVFGFIISILLKLEIF